MNVKLGELSRVTSVFLLSMLGYVGVAYAQLDAAALTGEIATTMQTYVTLAIQIISVVVLLIVGWAVISKFISAYQGRAEWGEVFLPIAIGVVIIAITGFLFAEAETLAGAIGA